MKQITFFGSGVEDELVKIDGIEIESIVSVVAKHYDAVKFGGTNQGLMGKFGKSSIANNLKLISVVPKYLKENYPEIIFVEGEQILTTSMSDRKEKLLDTDAILCYPGGIGTFDELFEALVKISFKEIAPLPIIIYNFERLYSPLLLQLETGIKTGLIKKEVMDNIYTFEHVDQLQVILSNINK